jgi:hypothetical protein
MTEGKRVMIRRWVVFLIGTHSRSRKNVIECEIDGPVKNERWIKVRLMAIEIKRMTNGVLGTKTRKCWKELGIGWGF